MASRFTELLVDANDVERLAEFWTAALGWQRSGRYAPDAIELVGPPGSGPTLVFLPVPERKTLKNRLHIDLSPLGCEQAEEVERLKGLGAREVDIGQGEQTWVVLADPEGNEFCVLRNRVD